MRIQVIIIVGLAVLAGACNRSSDKDSTFVEDIGPRTQETDSVAIFPVTNYLLGEIRTIEDLPVTPLTIRKSGSKSDSVWMKREDIRNASQPFLSPVIDSAYLRKYFTGSTFLDQSINTITITYEVLPRAVNGTPVRQISIYISPVSHQVERVYLVKETDDALQQLTWKSGHWFTIRNIKDQDVKEQKVIWNFDE